MSQPAESLGAEVVHVSRTGYDLSGFVETFRGFHREFSAAMDAGVPIEDLVVCLHREGVELPPFVLQMLGL